MNKSSIEISLIISIYKKIDYLELVFKSIAWQTFKSFEVIVAEDNDAKEMKEFIKEQREKYDFIIKHVSHPDVGFRKGKILNDAIKVADGDFLVFIDGDCILHRKFLNEYAKYKGEDNCLYGRRVMLDEETTDRLLKNKDIEGLSLLKLLKSKSSHLEEGIYLPLFRLDWRRKKVGIKGCNFGVSKANMYKINGFDEDYKNFTVGTDDDVKWRLQAIGLELQSLRNKAIQYHLFHGRINRYDIYEEHRKMYNQKKSQNKYFCDNGLIKK